MEPKWTSGDWMFVPREERPFGYQIMSGDSVVSHQNSACVSSRQRTRADNLDAVGFRMREPGGFTTRDEAIALIEEQNANGMLMASAKALYEAIEPELLEAIADELTGFEHSARAQSLRNLAKRQRAVQAKARGDR